MGAKDSRKQFSNIQRIKLLGADVVEVTEGDQTLKEAADAFKLLTRIEGIIPALESSHAIAYGIKIAKKYDKNDCIIINLSGRGDKDMDTILNYKTV